MTTHGMDRVFISVSDMDRSLAFFRDWIGLSVVAEDELNPGELVGLWELTLGTSARAIWLKNELSDTLIELVQFMPTSDRVIRDGRVNRDYGIYDLAFFVKDIDYLYRDLTAQGFQTTSPVVRYQPNWVPHEVKELIVLGPDNVPVVHFARLTDEADAYHRQYIKLNHTAHFTPSLDAATRFYIEFLGLDQRGRMTIPPGLVEEMLELPYGTRTDVNFFERAGSNTCLLEFLEINFPARPLGTRARPPNLGIFQISFEVDDLDGVKSGAESAGFNVTGGPLEMRDPLHGPVRALTLNAPGDLMVQLFQR